MSLPNALVVAAAILAVAFVLTNHWEWRSADKATIWRADRLTGAVEYCVAGNPPKCFTE